MSFISFKQGEKGILLNTDRIISVDFNSELNKALITCTDNVTFQVDDREESIRKTLGVKKDTDQKIGF